MVKTQATKSKQNLRKINKAHARQCKLKTSFDLYCLQFLVFVGGGGKKEKWRLQLETGWETFNLDVVGEEGSLGT